MLGVDKKPPGECTSIKAINITNLLILFYYYLGPQYGYMYHDAI